MDDMRTLHETADVATLNGWKAELYRPHYPAYDFNHLDTFHRFLNARLEASRQGDSELTECTNIKNAISTFLAYKRAIAECHTAAPIVVQRTIADLTAYAILHQPNITVGATHYGNAAMPPAMAQSGAALSGCRTRSRSRSRSRSRTWPWGHQPCPYCTR